MCGSLTAKKPTEITHTRTDTPSLVWGSRSTEICGHLHRWLLTLNVRQEEGAVCGPLPPYNTPLVPNGLHGCFMAPERHAIVRILMIQ